MAFPTILSTHGEILHNHKHDTELKKGDMLIVDCGAESKMHYAADITRTIPVDGQFTKLQQEIYEIVLMSQTVAIEAIKPDMYFRDVHLLAAKVIVEGLKGLGLLKGQTDDIVNEGAHALFFPHGLGHMLGLDVHDMESLGEDYVGYDENVKRSNQFGLAYLRMARALKPGMILTVEPGIYFIPQLIKKWKEENKLSDFIDFNKVEKYIHFGGIRIEDDIMITKEGNKILGNKIPKKIAELKQACKG
jgi:Xaa-Pro aminopeptidase